MTAYQSTKAIKVQVRHRYILSRTQASPGIKRWTFKKLLPSWTTRRMCSREEQDTLSSSLILSIISSYHYFTMPGPPRAVLLVNSATHLNQLRTLFLYSRSTSQAASKVLHAWKENQTQTISLTASKRHKAAIIITTFNSCPTLRLNGL